MVEQTLCTSETITHWALASNTQRVLSHTFMTRDCLLQHFHTTSYRPPVTHICRLVISHSLMQRERCWWLRNSRNIFEFSVQKYIRNRHFSSWDKIFVDQCYYSFLKATFAMLILDLISRLHLAAFVITPPKYLKYSIFSGCFWSFIICTGDDCLGISITWFFHIHFHSTVSSNFS